MRVQALDFDDYFREQYPVLVRELDFIVGDFDLACDIAHDAFLKQYVSWTRLSHFDKPGAWVRKVAVRLAFRARSRQSRFVSIDQHGDPAAPSVDSNRVLDVRKAIAQLSDSQRTAIVLHYYRDLPVTDIAKAMGIKDATVSVHLHRGRQALAELLISYGPTEKKNFPDSV